MKKILSVMLVCLAISCLSAFAAMQSNSYRIPSTVISGGGAPMSSDGYEMNGTIGQPSPLMDSGSTNFNLFPGFWYTLEAALYGCWWDIEPEPGDGDVDGSDLAGFADSFDEADLPAFASEFGRDDCL